MYDKYDMWVSDYITFVLQPSPTNGILPPAITVVFNSWEVWQVDENDGVDIELWTSEIGTSNSVVKLNGLSFVFNVNANYSPETRKKVFQLTHYVSKGCDISFTFKGYNSYIPTFPHTNPNFTPSDYSTEKRNRIVFVQQKGANGQTAYEYAYYEVLNNKLIIGKANFKRKLYSTSDKKDSLNRMIGIEDVYTSDNITVCRLFEIELNRIPYPYNIAVQLGCLQTDTVLRLAKEWTSTPSEETVLLPSE